MHAAAAESIDPATLDYCRRARRLRHRLRHAPATLHRCLATLPPVTPRLERPIPSVLDAPASERFALLVRYSLVGHVLPYNARQALIRKAVRMNISRFDANLIIATVQHRARGGTVDVEGSKSAWWVYAIAIAVQVAIVAAVYALAQ